MCAIIFFKNILFHTSHDDISAVSIDYEQLCQLLRGFLCANHAQLWISINRRVIMYATWNFNFYDKRWKTDARTNLAKSARNSTLMIDLYTLTYGRANFTKHCAHRSNGLMFSIFCTTFNNNFLGLKLDWLRGSFANQYTRSHLSSSNVFFFLYFLLAKVGGLLYKIQTFFES